MEDLPPQTNVGRRHLRFGWWSLLAFLTLGIVLEVLHGLKIGWYLDVTADTRRMMWTLAHAHGTLLALVNIAFGATLLTTHRERFAHQKLASACLIAAALVLPAGFFLGGTVIYSGDPGPGILLVPIGAGALLVGVAAVARAV